MTLQTLLFINNDFSIGRFIYIEDMFKLIRLHVELKIKKCHASPWGGTWTWRQWTEAGYCRNLNIL